MPFKTIDILWLIFINLLSYQYMKLNILVVGLNYDFSKSVAKELSNYFDMFFLDTDDLIEYSLMDVKKMQIVCGIEYFEKEKNKIIKSLNQYENTIINMHHKMFLEGDTSTVVGTNALIIYIGMNKALLHEENQKNGNLTVETIAYAELDNLLKLKSNISVNCDSLSVDSALKKILLKLKEINKG